MGTIKTVGTEKNIVGSIKFLKHQMNIQEKDFTSNKYDFEMYLNLIIIQLENSLKELKEMKTDIRK